MPPVSGLRAEIRSTVGPADTARALGSGDVDVLGTPRVVALLEAATVAAVRDALAAGQTTVGNRVEVDHLAPTRPGAEVTAEAVLTELDDRRLVFAVTLTEDGREVARGRVSRVVVDRSRFG
jgi:fluoroacetyl-CoA thioesterase